jgi:hypothetical protein
MTPLTEREMRMLLALVEMEQEKAEQNRDRHLETPVPGDAEEAVSLAYEQAYAQGFATGVSSIRKLVLEILNA